jgi:hypothetical protein
MTGLIAVATRHCRCRLIITYIASIKRKHWHTAETDAAEFENWMALVGGKLSINEQGYNILEPTIKIFEEKAKVTT